MSKGPWKFKPKKNSVFRKRRKINPNSIQALRSNSVPFKKNDPVTGEKDPRINRAGAPKTTLEARRFIRELGERLIAVKGAKGEKEKQEQVMLLEKMITDMYLSKAPLDHQNILRSSFPGILGEDEEGGDGKGKPKEMVLRVVYENRTRAAPEDVIETDAEDLQEVELPDRVRTALRRLDQRSEHASSQDTQE